MSATTSSPHGTSSKTELQKTSEASKESKDLKDAGESTGPDQDVEISSSSFNCSPILSPPRALRRLLFLKRDRKDGGEDGELGESIVSVGNRRGGGWETRGCGVFPGSSGEAEEENEENEEEDEDQAGEDQEGEDQEEDEESENEDQERAEKTQEQRSEENPPKTPPQLLKSRFSHPPNKSTKTTMKLNSNTATSPTPVQRLINYLSISEKKKERRRSYSFPNHYRHGIIDNSEGCASSELELESDGAESRQYFKALSNEVYEKPISELTEEELERHYDGGERCPTPGPCSRGEYERFQRGGWNLGGNSGHGG